MSNWIQYKSIWEDNDKSNIARYTSMIEKIANELGLELGQEFILYGSKYKFNKNGLLLFNGNDWVLTYEALTEIVTDNAVKNSIKKSKWKPKYNEEYYFPYLNSTDVHTYSYNYNDDEVDYYFYNNGLMCKTKEEAEELYDYIIEKVKEYRNNDI